MITRRRLLEIALPAVAVGASPAALRALSRGPSQEVTRINVWQHPGTPGCCSPWVADMVEAGFTVQMERAGNHEKLRRELGIPEDLWCCHTAVIEGYIIEGHATPDDIRRLLDDRPILSGLAAPDYMDDHGRVRTEGTYDVMAFQRNGMRSVYATHELPG